MDHQAKMKYCGLLMFDVPTPDSPTTPTSPKSRASPYTKPSGKEHRVSRPPNAFILYRHSIQPTLLRQYPHITNSEVSKHLATMWKNEPDSVKLQWQKEADRRKVEHMAAHPDYVYAPKKPAGQKKARKSKAVRGVQEHDFHVSAPASIKTEAGSEGLLTPPMSPELPSPPVTSPVDMSHPDTAYQFNVNDLQLAPFDNFDIAQAFPDYDQSAMISCGVNFLAEQAYNDFSYAGLLASENLDFVF